MRSPDYDEHEARDRRRSHLFRYPRDRYELAGLTLLLAALLTGAYLLLKLTPPGGKASFGAAFLTFAFESKASASDEGGIATPVLKGVDAEEGKTLSFWTPSTLTYADIKQGLSTEDDHGWERVTDSDVDAFEAALWQQFHGADEQQVGPLYGLRRYETVGRGRHSHKHGWWWTLRVRKSFDPGDLAKYYVSFWCKSHAPSCEKTVYIEQSNESGAYAAGQ